MIECFAPPHDDARALIPVTRAEGKDALTAWPGLAEQAALAGFDGAPGSVVISQEAGRLVAALGIGDGTEPGAFGAGARALPVSDYVLAGPVGALAPGDAALAWAEGAYAFTRYKPAGRAPARLVMPEGADEADVLRQASALARGRDLINTPTEDMGPQHLEEVVRALGEAHGAQVRVTRGEALLGANYPLIHAVGRAAGPARAPRLLELEWGAEDAPRLAIVGKGVMFDTGGLNIKTGDFMRLMKKDMGGAAHALAIAEMVMAAGLKVRLHLLIPAVENAVSGDAFRPGDILASRKGLSVEIENTDAEGRLVLADALARACEGAPDLVLDFATLTGAARVALGPDLPPFYTDDEALAAALTASAAARRDPMWRMPLWSGYDADIESPIADLKNLGSGVFAGSIAAALFLRRFVDTTSWVHFDVFAWNPKARPGRAQGGAMQGARATYHLLCERYGV